MNSFPSAPPPSNNGPHFSFPPVQKCHACISDLKKSTLVALFSLVVVKNINIFPAAISGFKNHNMVLGIIWEVFFLRYKFIQ